MSPDPSDVSAHGVRGVAGKSEPTQLPAPRNVHRGGRCCRRQRSRDCPRSWPERLRTLRRWKPASTMSETTPAALSEPLVAQVKDMTTGEMSLFQGEREVVVRIPALARSLLSAARQ